MDWFLRSLTAEGRKGCVVYLGDELTDEDAFRAVRHVGGLGIRVGPLKDRTEASYVVSGIREVQRFLSASIRNYSYVFVPVLAMKSAPSALSPEGINSSPNL